MKSYLVVLDDALAAAYEIMAAACGQPTEIILENTLLKTMELLLKKAEKP